MTSCFALPTQCTADPVLRMLRKGIWGNNEQRRWWELCTGVSSAAKVRKELITDTGIQTMLKANRPS